MATTIDEPSRRSTPGLTTQTHIGSYHDWERIRFRPHGSRAGERRSHSAADRQARMPGLVRIVDLLVVIGVGIACIRFEGATGGSVPRIEWLEIALAAILFVNYLGLGRSYRFKILDNATAQGTRVSLAWVAAVATVTASQFAVARIFAIAPERFQSRTVIWFSAAWVAALASRIALKLWIEHERQRGRWTIKIAIAGSGMPAFDLARRVRGIGRDDIDIVGVFVDRTCPLQGANTIEDLYDRANSERIDTILIALPWPSATELNAAVRKLCILPVDVQIYPGAPGLGLARSDIDSVTGLPTLPIQRRPLIGWGGPLKRAEDIIFVVILLCALAPVFLLIALLIKLDSRGPVFFRQQRFGFNNNSICVYKFRTMRHDLAPDPMIRQAQRNDPRITRLGAFLRHTSLDELPQLFNVLGGSMSLAGPRPHATIHNKKYGRLIDGYLGRHRMKPGITGWAQVNGHRGETDTIEKMRLRLQHDIYYIDRWSLMLDLKILAMTVPAVIRGQNAY